MRLPKSRFLLPVLLVWAAGCTTPDRSPTVATPAWEGTAALGLSASEQGAHEVARLLALAMRDPGVRVQVRDAMRRSPFTEHKLVLQHFLATPAGRHLARAAAAAGGLTEAQLVGRVALLPPMDFYAPFRDHRLAWRGTADVLVGATLAPSDSALAAFGTDGREVILRAAAGPPASALLVLHPAERKGIRMAPQADRPGATIQEPGDGEVSGTLEWTASDGTRRRARLGGGRAGGGDELVLTSVSCDPTALVPCDPDYQTGLPVPEPADTTFAEQIWINYSDAFGAGAVEVELRSEFHSGGALVDRYTLRLEGLNPGTTFRPHKPLMFRRMREGSSDFIRIEVVETDVWVDDHKGSRDFYYTDRDQVRSILDETWWPQNQNLTNLRLDWTPVP